MTIESTLKEAADQLANDSIGALSLPMRTKIWNACHDIVGSENYRAFRAKLDLECLEHVPHIRDAIYPEDTALDELMSIPKKIFTSQITIKKDHSIAGNHWVDHVDDATYTPGTEPEIYIAADASSAATLATLPPESYEEDPYNGRLDTDLDPWGFETEYWCASAYCTKLNWDENSEAVIVKRREYWE